MPSTRKAKTSTANGSSPASKQKTPKKGRKAAEEEVEDHVSPATSNVKDTLQKVHSQIMELGEDGVKKVASRHVLGVQGGRISKRGGKISIKKKVIRQLEVGD